MLSNEKYLPNSTKSDAWWCVTPGGTLHGVFLFDEPITVREFKRRMEREWGKIWCRGTKFFVKTRIGGPLERVR